MGGDFEIRTVLYWASKVASVGLMIYGIVSVAIHGMDYSLGIWLAASGGFLMAVTTYAFSPKEIHSTVKILWRLTTGR